MIPADEERVFEVPAEPRVLKVQRENRRFNAATEGKDDVQQA